MVWLRFVVRVSPGQRGDSVRTCVSLVKGNLKKVWEISQAVSTRIVVLTLVPGKDRSGNG